MINKSLHVVTVFYGSGYALLVTEFMWPSLVKHNPKVFVDYKVSHRIYCRPDDAWSVAKHCEKLKACGIHTYVNTRILPNLQLSISDQTNNNEIRNNHVWVCLVDAMRQALKEGSIMVYALPDHFFGHGLENVLKDTQSGEYHVCCHLRIPVESTLPIIDAKLCGNGFSSNGDLVDFCFNHRHPLVQHGFDNPNSNWRAEDRNDHYAVWFWQPVPVVISPTQGLIDFYMSGGYCGNPCFELMDHDLVEWAYNNDKLKCVKDSNGFFWAELTSKRCYIPRPYVPDRDNARVDIQPFAQFAHGDPFKYYKGINA